MSDRKWSCWSRQVEPGNNEPRGSAALRRPSAGPRPPESGSSSSTQPRRGAGGSGRDRAGPPVPAPGVRRHLPCLVLRLSPLLTHNTEMRSAEPTAHAPRGGREKGEQKETKTQETFKRYENTRSPDQCSVLNHVFII